MIILGLKELTSLGLHFGHLKSRTHPKSKPYVYAVRNGVSIINLETTQEKLKEALAYVKKIAKEKKTILFICAKKQLSDFIKEKSDAINMPYSNKRFIGGALTNFSEILKNINRLNNLSEKEKELQDSGNKKEYRRIKKEKERLEFLLGGLSALRKLPDVLFIIDAASEKNAILEANSLNIPIISITDTDADPSKIEYPIPANDDSVEGVKYIVSEIVRAYKGDNEKTKKDIKAKKSDKKVKKAPKTKNKK